jgi:flavin reductase (DIM6/NTAB) family NADH-FMN oxidoreductase RutF
VIPAVPQLRYAGASDCDQPPPAAGEAAHIGTAPEPDTDLVDIRRLMVGFPTGVGIVTTITADQRCWGMTCTSLCSVSLYPPTLLVCLREGSRTLRGVLDAGTFALNLLHAGARSTAELFASGDPDRFGRVSWQLSERGAGPHLVDAAHTTADCRVVNAEQVGDHSVVFGEVFAIVQRAEPRPLVYGLRLYAGWPSGAARATLGSGP